MPFLRPIYRAALPLLACVSVAGSLVACSSGSNSTPGGSGPLESALGQIRFSSGTAPDVEFGRPAAAVAANGGTTALGSYSQVAGLGAGDLVQFSQVLPKVLGFDPLRATYAVTAGQPPNSGTLLAGLPSVAGVKTLATALGATATKSGSSSTYRFRPDRRISVDDKLSKALPGSLGPDVIRTTGSDLRYAQSTAGLDLTSASGKTLAGFAPYQAVASCLHDPLGGYLAHAVPALHSVQDPSQRSSATPTAGITAVGVGVGGARGSTPQERLCVAADTAAHATTIAAAITKALASGSSTVSNTRWSTMFTDTSVERTGTTVTMTAHPGQQGSSGVLLASYLRGDLPGLVGR